MIYAMKLALGKIKSARDCHPNAVDALLFEAEEILEAALAEQPAQQEPVAYLCENAVGHKYFRWKKPSSTYKPIALYTSPPAQRTWVGLTDEDMAQWIEEEHYVLRWAEDKLKEKNT